MKTSIVKRSIIIGGHKSSVSLEDPFWDAMKEIAALKGTTLIQLVRSTGIASTTTCPRQSGFSFSTTTGIARLPTSRFHRKQKQACQAIDRACVSSRNQISIEARNISAQQMPIARVRHP